MGALRDSSDDAFKLTFFFPAFFAFFFMDDPLSPRSAANSPGLVPHLGQSMRGSSTPSQAAALIPSELPSK
jgi:hypothetical protein